MIYGPFARSASISEPLARWPLVTIVWVFEAPGYFWGAFRHNRLRAPEFWAFTWDTYNAAMRGAFIGWTD